VAKSDSQAISKKIKEPAEQLKNSETDLFDRYMKWRDGVRKDGEENQEITPKLTSPKNKL
jgi:hypothetical protein